MKPLIISLCDLTGNWPKFYRESGEYDVISIDLQTGTDVLTYEPPRRPYGVLAAPPCTYFASSGARWFNDPIRRPPEGMENAKAVVRACLRIGRMAEKFYAIENPVGIILREVPEIGPVKHRFDPCAYSGHVDGEVPYTKLTCLYGNFNTRLPINYKEPTGPNPIHHCPPGPERANFRSVTPLGFAKAFFLANR